MGFDIKGPTYVGDTIHVEIEVSEIKPTSKDASRALVRTTNIVKNQKGEIVLIYTPLRMLQDRFGVVHKFPGGCRIERCKRADRDAKQSRISWRLVGWRGVKFDSGQTGGLGRQAPA